jgi:hypothetical protein
MTARNMSTPKHVLRTAVRCARNARQNGRLASPRASSFVPVLVQPLIVRHKNSVAGFNAAASHLRGDQGNPALQTHRRNNLSSCVASTRYWHPCMECVLRPWMSDDRLNYGYAACILTSIVAHASRDRQCSKRCEVLDFVRIHVGEPELISGKP